MTVCTLSSKSSVCKGLKVYDFLFNKEVENDVHIERVNIDIS